MLRIEFVPVTHQHLPMLREWMERPHWREWWGEPEAELANVAGMVGGRDTTRPFIFQVEGQPAGYIQQWFISHPQNDQWTRDNPWLLDLPSNSVGVDISIAAPEMMGRGIGSATLRQFVGKLRTEGHSNIIIDPDPANTRAVRAYEKAGFRPILALLGRSGDTFIMQHHE